MIFEKQPANYATAFGPLAYRLTGCDAAASLDAELIDLGTGRVVGVKRLRGAAQYEFDVAGYVRRLLDFVPAAAGLGFAAKPGHTARVQVRVGELLSAPLTVTGAATDFGLLCGPQRRTLGRDEADEICVTGAGTFTGRFVLAGSGGEHTVEIAPLVAGEGMAMLAFCVPALDEALIAAGENPAQFDTLRVEAGGVVVRIYDLVNPNPDAVRVAWVNPQGGIDRYSFVACTGETLAPDPATGLAERAISVVSDLEPAAPLRWLGEIPLAPAVWIMRDGKFVPVRVAAKPVELAPAEGPGRLRLTLVPTGAQILCRL